VLRNVAHLRYTLALHGNGTTVLMDVQNTAVKHQKFGAPSPKIANSRKTAVNQDSPSVMEPKFVSAQRRAAPTVTKTGVNHSQNALMNTTAV
jgi:hypothetical protein